MILRANRILLFFLTIIIQSLYYHASIQNKIKKTLSPYSQNIENSIHIMSFNIKYNHSDNVDNSWSNRKDMVSNVIIRHHPDLLGLQEALKDQIDDLVDTNSNYSWFGVGREDGKENGEFVPIFYRQDRFDLLEHSTFWLSDKPEVPGSIGWDAKHTRTVTWGKFKERRSGKILFHFNTHFDKQGQLSREESSKLLLIKIDEIANAHPSILTGDLNFTKSSKAYNILTNEGQLDLKFSGLELKDAMDLAIHGHFGPLGTISDFKKIVTPFQKIDYIFVKNNVKVIRHFVLKDMMNGRFPSDHLPVLVEIMV